MMSDLKEKVEELLAEETCSNCKHAQPWQDITTAPKDGSHILLYRPEIQFIGYYAKAGWCINVPGLPVMNDEPTHWMPVPVKPKAKHWFYERMEKAEDTRAGSHATTILKDLALRVPDLVQIAAYCKGRAFASRAAGGDRPTKLAEMREDYNDNV